MAKRTKAKRVSTAKSKGIYILTKTPYSLLPKSDVEVGNTLFLDLTGLEKKGGHNVLVFGRNRDPTSIMLLLEQILDEVDVDYVNIETIDPFLLDLEKIEVMRFLDHLRSFLALRSIKFYVGGRRNGEEGNPTRKA